MNINIKNELYNEINDYIKFNNIENIDNFIENLIIKAFNIEKYGLTPFDKMDIKDNIEVKNKQNIKNNITDKSVNEKQEVKKKVRIIKND